MKLTYQEVANEINAREAQGKLHPSSCKDCPFKSFGKCRVLEEIFPKIKRDKCPVWPED